MRFHCAAVSGYHLSNSKLVRIAQLAISVGLVLAGLTVALIWLAQKPEPDPTAGLDLATFEAYGDAKNYWDTWTVVHASQSIVGPIVARLIGDRRTKKTTRGPEPIDSDRKIRLVGANLYDITGRPLSLASVVATVRNATTAGWPIPPVLHYFLRERLTRMQSVCLRSAVQHVRPVRIFIWLRSPSVGGGVHWSRLLASAEANGWSSRIIVAINRFAGELNSEAAHQLERLDALLVFGGIALDPDVLTVQSPRSLLHNRVPVLGWNDTSEDSCGDALDRISVDVIMSAPLSPLLFIWRLAIHYARDLAGGADWRDYDASLVLRLLQEALPDRLRLVDELYLSASQHGGYFVRVP